MGTDAQWGHCGCQVPCSTIAHGHGMRVIPVLDLMKGQAVRGVAGRRYQCRPIVSWLTTSDEPGAVARAFRTHFGADELYVADLDAIAGQAPALALVTELIADGFDLWVDAGIGAGGQHLAALAAAGV